jgi:hypothetical protein
VTDVIPTPAGVADDVAEFVKEHTDQQADIAKAKEATAGPVPLIQDSVDPHVDLPRGLMHNGSWNTRAVVRELTGMDEEAMARVKDITEIYDTVLALGTTRIGEVDLAALPLVERQGLVQQLLLGERDMLYVGIIRMTYGDRKTMILTCPNCNERQELIVTLSEDFKVTEVDDVAQTEFDYTSSKGDQIRYRPAVGADQMEALRRKGASMAEQNSILLSRCIKTVNGDLVVNPMDYARRLPLRDRHALLGALIEHQPSVDMTVTVDCVACREEQTIALGWGDLFQP